MSNSLAIATVTRALQGIVQQAVGSVVPGAAVLTRSPTKISDTDQQNSSVNLFLFQATANDAWRNEDLPARSADGTLRRRPRLAVDLHFILSFHGDDTMLVPQRMLGAVLAELHREPRLTVSAIRGAIAMAGGDHGPLGDSDLADQVESITFSLQRPNLEELSKIWSVLFQVPYSLSAFYVASVVFLEPDVQPTPVVPVGADGIVVDVTPRLPEVEAAAR
jgi:hypothetical protein